MEQVLATGSRYVSVSSKSFLCFGGRLRLSGMTRVEAGARPEARARRRASLPASKRFFLVFLTTTSLQMSSLMPSEAWSTIGVTERATETGAGGIQLRQADVDSSYLGNAKIPSLSLFRPARVRLGNTGAKQCGRTAAEGNRSVRLRGEELHRI